MKEEKEVKISFWAAHLTTIVSVTLVLLIIGVIAMASISASRETRRLKEKIEISLVLADSISDVRARQIYDDVKSKPYALDTRLISRDEALANWKADTGEDLESLFGVNPLSPEVAFTVKADYSDRNNLQQITSQLAAVPDVEEVATPDASMVESMNSNIETLSIVLGCIAAVLVIISFVLINNTVHLTIYSRRFTIHTMQLVGATNGFIRRPVVTSNMLAGLTAAIFASALLSIAMWLVPGTSGFALTDYVTWTDFAFISISLVIIGTAICAIAAAISTSVYLRKDYDQLFG